jgi:hemin uptake protein HemP
MQPFSPTIKTDNETMSGSGSFAVGQVPFRTIESKAIHRKPATKEGANGESRNSRFTQDLISEHSSKLPKIIPFDTLARCGEEIWIENNGQIYRLRRTKQGKLILTK